MRGYFKQLKDAISRNDDSFVRTMKPGHEDFALYWAAYYNKKDIIYFCLAKGVKHSNHGLWGASDGNHTNLVKKFIELHNADDLEMSLDAAIQNNNIGLIEYLDKKKESLEA
jgi:hypothetical protein